MGIRRSPFIYEDAVPLDKFFNREEELEFLTRNLSVKRKILLCIVAPLKYGKSSLMLKYLDILNRYDDIIPVYINLGKIDKPIKHMLRQLVRVGIDLKAEYDNALEEESLLDLFEKLGTILERRNLWLFLLFDEFHLLPELIRSEGFYGGLSDKVIFNFFRGFAEGKRISYIVCGSMIEPLMEAIDVWGGRFEIIYLGPFSENSAVDMIKKLFAEGGVSINDEYARIIAEAAGYHPFYIQYMGHHIYALGAVNNLTIRLAKRKLHEFLAPIFDNYFKRMLKLGKEYLETIKKIIAGEFLDIWDRARASDLRRMGILKPKNARYEFIDPLFERYMEQIVNGLEPVEVTVVGHWAERLVGNYLLRRGFTPYYSHDSRGAFDIYVKIQDIDVGIQVKFSVKGEIYLSRENVEKILTTAREMGWKPLVAIVGKELRFIPRIRPGKLTINDGHSDILEALL